MRFLAIVTVSFLIATTLSATAAAAPCVRTPAGVGGCIADPDGNGIPNVGFMVINTPAGRAVITYESHGTPLGGSVAIDGHGRGVPGVGMVSLFAADRDGNGDGAPDRGVLHFEARGASVTGRGAMGAHAFAADRDGDGVVDGVVIMGGSSTPVGPVRERVALP